MYMQTTGVYCLLICPVKHSNRGQAHNEFMLIAKLLAFPTLATYITLSLYEMYMSEKHVGYTKNIHPLNFA